MKKNPRRPKILSFGEVLWDLFPEGPEFGGAPANFAFHCTQLGAEVHLLSRIGKDSLGKELLRHCDEIGLSTALIGIEENAPTGIVEVKLDPKGKPAYTIVENSAWDHLQADSATLQWAEQCDALYFGSLAARSGENRKTLRNLLDASPKNALKVLDLNLRDPFCEISNIEFVMSRANILKINDEELPRIREMFEFAPSSSLQDQLRNLRNRWNFRLVILTCGEKGSWLSTESEQVFTPSQEVEIVDTVGAGDAFTASAIIDFLLQKSLSDIAKNATKLAAYVCSRAGGTPPLPQNGEK